jgi:hypothetical protein
MPEVSASRLGASRNTERTTVAAPDMRFPFLNETARMTWLSTFLRVLSVGFLAAFIPWITLILLNAPILAPAVCSRRGSGFSRTIRITKSCSPLST